MKHVSNDRIDLTYETPLEESVQGLINLLTFFPHAVRPERKADEKTVSAYAAQGFRLYPTVLNTTLFYDERSDCFFKMLHPLGPKRRMLFSITDRARQIYTLSRELNAWGVPLPKIRAYGKIRGKNVPVFAMERVRGRSLYDMVVRDGQPLPMKLGLKVMDMIARIHRSGYWLGDAHLSHIFADDTNVTGLIDVDSMRRNLRTGTRNFAKDLAGLDHPLLPLTGEEKKELADHYLQAMEIADRAAFLRALKTYSERRWKR
jgi:tRNA A-37 threonylcarbamoyl transferase component Bud32